MSWRASTGNSRERPCKEKKVPFPSECQDEGAKITGKVSECALSLLREETQWERSRQAPSQQCPQPQRVSMISEPSLVRRHLFYALLNSDKKMTQEVPETLRNAPSWA